MTGHVEMRRGSPLVANELLVAEAERVRSRDPRRAAGMFLEASVSHMITGDMHALVATAERARALATAADPAVELLATTVIGEAYLALGDVEQGEPLLSACEPYLLEGDPLAIVEVVGMAAHASIWIEKFDRAQRILDHLIAAARDASAVSALIYPLAAQLAPGLPARPLGGGAGRAPPSRSSSRRTPGSRRCSRTASRRSPTSRPPAARRRTAGAT